MKKDKFYEMLSEIHNEVSDMSCGCMGSKYTPGRVKRNDEYMTIYDSTSKISPYPVEYKKSKEPRDYIGNIIRKYIKIK